MKWTLDRITVTYRLADGSLVRALREVTLDIATGERLAIVGPNGSGKSALALCLAGLIVPTEGCITTPGRLSDDSSQVTNESESALESGEWAALVFQNPDDNLIARTVAEELSLTLEHAAPVGGNRADVHDILRQFRLSSLADRPVVRLSGGEKQTLALACALAARRHLIVLDEPTSHLDPPSRRALLRLLTGRGSQFGSDGGVAPAMALITQYEDEARQFPRIVELSDGRVVYDGRSEIWTAPQRQRGRLLNTGVLPASGAINVLTAAGLDQREQPGWPLPPSPLRGIDLAVHAGDAIGLCGPIGSGKSTLAFHLAGLIPSRPGSVVNEFGTSDQGLPVVLIQFPERQLFCPTVMEDVSWGPQQKGLPVPAVRAAAERLLDRLQLPVGEFGARSPFALSGGQRRRAAIAGAAVCPAPLYILDEPTAALDVKGTERLEGLLSEWHEAGTAFIIISHDLGWLERVTTRVWVIDRGRIEFDGLWGNTAILPSVLERLGFGPLE